MGDECCERELRKGNLQHHGFIEIGEKKIA
jgi:hypothetical protein